MTGIRVLVALLAVAGVSRVYAADALPGENIIEVKITLPKGETYLRGASDPVQDLWVEMTLTNKTKKEDLNKETISVTKVDRLTGQELAELQQEALKKNLKVDEQVAMVAKKKTEVQKEQYKINQESVGYAYTEPQLGPHDNVEFVITKVAEEGDAPAADNAKPKVIVRDNKPEHIAYVDVAPVRYLAAGETSPVFNLPVGKFYKINEPGTYSIKAVLRLVGDNSKGQKYAESNEEKFRVLPFKVVSAKIEEVQENWEHYERGFPSFDYMLYQVKTSGQFDEVWYAQRIPVRRVDRYEWTRLCSVKPGSTVQVAQIDPKKVAVLAIHAKGDAGLYTVDFSKPGAKVTTETRDVKDGAPKLKVEGGKAAFE
ncbi:MAG TPA: hypothetical protein VEJ63_07020 [Planctomycetota bacterium]|nr:hypothetical protein [Planctomycetota bacterium]